MPFDELDTGAVARLLALVADQEDDVAEVFFERAETYELPPDEVIPGVRRWQEEGLAVRVVRGLREGSPAAGERPSCWAAARDGISGERLAAALRQVARVVPRTGLPEPQLAAAAAAGQEAAAGAVDPLPLAQLARRVPWLLRQEHVAFPLRLTVREHRRAVRVVGPRLVAPTERERFWSLAAQMPWGGYGALLGELDDAAAEAIAVALLASFRARETNPPSSGVRTVVLGPEATAVLLHEVVAHALEADTLALGGRPEAAIGLALGAVGLDVLDDPGAAPAGCRRTTDDEGMPVVRRWLLRDGVVEAPLADRSWSARAPALVPGAARRASRHDLPGPRSSCLELLPGGSAEADLLADAEGGLYVTTVRRGSLDPASGGFSLEVPFAATIRRGALAEPVGPFALRGTVADLLRRVTAVGADTRPAGAGWCAKGGQRVPVWALAPSLRVEGVAVHSGAASPHDAAGQDAESLGDPSGAATRPRREPPGSRRSRRAAVDSPVESRRDPAPLSARSSGEAAGVGEEPRRHSTDPCAERPRGPRRA